MSYGRDRSICRLDVYDPLSSYGIRKKESPCSENREEDQIRGVRRAQQDMPFRNNWRRYSELLLECVNALELIDPSLCF
jgi:hypothetical protein